LILFGLFRTFYNTKFGISHKKVFRLMKENQVLTKRSKRRNKGFAQYRIVIPQGLLEPMEMDIKNVWIAKSRICVLFR